MNDEQTIHDESPGNETAPGQPNDENTPEQSTNNSDQPANMEVHKHPHHVTHKKKWTEYLLEFLMLFLAVFLGFIAENIREHKVERSREKEYLRSMLVDLKTDTSNIARYYSRSDSTIFIIDSLINLIKRPDRDNYGRDMYYFARVITTKVGRFALTDRAFEEMKSSGSLRLVNNEALSDSISHYYGEQTRFREQSELQIIRMTAYSDLVTEIFDGSVFQKMLQRFPYNVIPPEGNPQLLTTEPAKINKLIGLLHYYSAILVINSSYAKQKSDHTANLIGMIEKEYDL